MTQKKTKAEIPTDMWLHVATDALARYVAGGGDANISGMGFEIGDPYIVVMIPVGIDDPRLPPSFVDLLGRVPQEETIP